MNKEQLKALVDHIGGAEYVIGMRFKNGYKLVYSRHILDLEEDIKTFGGLEMLIYEHMDTNENIVKSFLPLEEIAQVYTLTDLDDDVILRDIME